MIYISFNYNWIYTFVSLTPFFVSSTFRTCSLSLTMALPLKDSNVDIDYKSQLNNNSRLFHHSPSLPDTPTLHNFPSFSTASTPLSSPLKSNSQNKELDLTHGQSNHDSVFYSLESTSKESNLKDTKDDPVKMLSLYEIAHHHQIHQMLGKELPEDMKKGISIGYSKQSNLSKKNTELPKISQIHNVELDDDESNQEDDTDPWKIEDRSNKTKVIQ